MTTQGGNYEEFVKYCVEFHKQYHNEDEESLEDWKLDCSQPVWDSAALAILKKVQQQTGSLL
jgi:hypothetical protein